MRRPNCWTKTNFDMKIEISQKELHEIICGLSKNRGRIRARLNHTERQLSVELLDKDRELYLSTLRTLRQARIQLIDELISKLESIKYE